MKSQGIILKIIKIQIQIQMQEAPISPTKNLLAKTPAAWVVGAERGAKGHINIYGKHRSGQQDPFWGIRS